MSAYAPVLAQAMKKAVEEARAAGASVTDQLEQVYKAGSNDGYRDALRGMGSK